MFNAMFQKPKNNFKLVFILFMLVTFGYSPLLSQRFGKFSIPISLGYHKTTFLNPIFAQNSSNKIIKNRYGFNVGFFHDRKYFFWEIKAYNSSFNLTTNDIFLPRDVILEHYNIEIGSSFKIIPKSKYFTPLIGLNYQFSSLRGYTADDSKTLLSRINTSGLMWMGKVRIMFSSRIGLLFTYQQSIPASVKVNNDESSNPSISFEDKQKSYSQLGLSLLVRIGGTYSMH